MATNEGIHMTGGHIDAGALAVGANARATNITTAEQALTDQGHAELAARLAEVTKPKPNRITLTGLLNALAAGVSPVTALATAVDALARAATVLF